ncbi:Protein transport protein Sec61 subunit alpha, partial [Bienertia sinuspersici]
MGGGFRILHLVRPFLSFLPKLPLYGIHSTTGADPFYWILIILASNRGTIMELVDNNVREDRELLGSIKFLFIMDSLSSACLSKLCVSYSVELYLYQLLIKKVTMYFMNRAQKLLGILIAVGEAVAYVLSGMYGSVELLRKGYGLGSAISLFITTNICEIIWKAFSPITINASRGPEFEALREAFYRQNLPNVTNLLATILIFLIVIYFQGFCVVLPARSKNARGQQRSYPIKLFYTSNMPIILLLHRKYSKNLFQTFWVSGRSQNMEANLSHLADMAANPFHALSYIIFILSTCALFSKTLIEKELNRYIPIVAVFGGVCIGALTVLVDFMVLLAQVLVFCLQSPSLTSILKHLKRREQANSASLGFKSRATVLNRVDANLRTSNQR